MRARRKRSRFEFKIFRKQKREKFIFEISNSRNLRNLIAIIMLNYRIFKTINENKRKNEHKIKYKIYFYFYYNKKKNIKSHYLNKK